MRVRGGDEVSLGQAEVIGFSDLALKCQVEDREKPLWVPRSVIHDASEVYGTAPHNNSGELIVATWWAEKNGLI